MIRASIIIAALCFALAAAQPAPAQIPIPGRCEVPVSERTSETGCYLAATHKLGELPQTPLYWHLYNYSSGAEAEAAKGPRSTVVESFGKTWLYTIAEESWRPAGGVRIAAIGPLKVMPGKQYTARYMEALTLPGMTGIPHRHAGPEAWYMISGRQCLETPEGIVVAGPGESVVVPEGPVMNIESVGMETRRSVLLVLHDASHHWVARASDWTPKGLCPK